jgi:hypothetical protein
VTTRPLESQDVLSIYFVEAIGTGRIKIGITGNVTKRMQVLGAQCPVPTRLLCVLSGTMATERALLRLFSADRAHGEWFTASESLRAFVQSTEHHKRELIAPLIAADPGELLEIRRRQRERAARFRQRKRAA